MKNIFRENRRLKAENKELKLRIESMSNELFKMQELYESKMKAKLKWMESQYKTTVERKKQVVKICEIIETKIKDIFSATKESLICIDISKDIEIYLKLLDYLKGENK